MKIGDKCKMTKDALDNYGHEYKDVIFVVTHVADKYMPAKEFFASGMPNGYHPGYDSLAGDKLYDLILDGRNFENSLYGWELRYIGK